MDIATQVEIVLREAGFDTWQWSGAVVPVICFENSALMGFVHVFPSAEDLLSRWQSAQNAVLSRHGAALRAAGAKAWNVYSVFLTEDGALTQQRSIERIEEDFALTRKIARAAIRTHEDVERALLPLTAVRAQPVLSETDFEDRLRERLRNVSADVLAAFLGSVPAEDVAKILAEKP